MIGIIIWLLLIFIIACCACPGFLTALAVIFGICALGILVLWLLAKLTDKRAEEARTDRENPCGYLEASIDQWERLHGTKHFSRVPPEERERWLKSLK